MTPLVSIVIPVYNGTDYLASAIDSALAQTYRNVEVVVVNDGSTDGGATEAVAKSYGERIRYFSKPNGHVASALNFGVARMHGAYFSWLSHDDLYTPDKIERQMRAVAALGADTIVYSDFEELRESDGMITPIRLHAVPPEHFRYFLTTRNALHGCTLLVPKRCLDGCGPFNESLRTTQDYDMWFRLGRDCRFVHVPGILVTSRQHAAQGSVALRDTAQPECDRLLAGFVKELQPGELMAATGEPIDRAYVLLARNLGARGFGKACAVALDRARAALNDASIAARARLALESALLVPAELAFAPLRPHGHRAIHLLKSVLRPAYRTIFPRDAGTRFTRFYHRNVFGGRESRSGEGSTLEQTATIARDIPLLLRELGARSFLDAPCGDFNWMRHVDLGVDRYIGIDVVSDIVSANQERFSGDGREFLCRDLINDSLPAADVVLCRDCLVHLSFRDARKVVRNFKRSGCNYLLTTTFTGRNENVDLTGDGIWRTLNLERPPFNFPPPLRLINEHCTEGGGAYADKSLALWRLEGLPLD